MNVKQYEKRKEYENLLSGISSLCDSSRLSSVQINWQIGRSIAGQSSRCDQSIYGKAVLKRLSRDLTKKYGRGFSVTNLTNMRSFSSLWSYNEISVEVEWSKYVFLMTIKDPGIRRSIEKRVIDESLSSFDLRKIISSLRFDDNSDSRVLSAGRGRLHVFPLADDGFPDSRSGSLTVDCGFGIFRSVVKKGRALPDGSRYIVSEKLSRGYSLTDAGPVSSGDLYTYTGRVYKIIDADTIGVIIDCGFGTSVKQKLRLRGIDAPELDSHSGEKARDFVARALKDCPLIGLKTYKSGKYGRYLSDVFFIPGVSDGEKIIREGRFLNQELLNKGHAVRVR